MPYYLELAIASVDEDISMIFEYQVTVCSDTKKLSRFCYGQVFITQPMYHLSLVGVRDLLVGARNYIKTSFPQWTLSMAMIYLGLGLD